MLRRLLAHLVVAVALAAPAAAVAAPTPGPASDVPGAPQHIAGTADGGAWVALDGSGLNAEDYARVAPDGTVSAFGSPDLTGAKGITVGPGGEVWVTGTGVIGHFSPATPQALTAIPVPGLNPQTIVTGPDGNLWTASDDDVLRVTPAGVVTAFTVTGMSARGIASAADTLLVADSLGGQLVRVAVDGTTTPVPVAAGPGLQEVAVDAAGGVAVTQPVNAPVGVTLLPSTFVPIGGDQTGIVAAPDGAFWTAGFASTGLTRIARDGTTAPLVLGTGLGPRHLAVAGLGRLWVALETAKRVQRVDGVQAPPVVAPPAATPPVPAVTPTPGTGPPRPSFALTAGRTRALRRAVRVELRTTVATSVRLTLQRELSGRRNRKGTCVRRTRAPRGARCVRRLLAVRTRVVQLTADKRRVVRFNRVRTPGTYRVRVAATAPGAVRVTTVTRVRVLG